MRTDRKKNGKKNGVLPTSLPAIQPKVAGIDVGSSQHWVCGPAKDDGKPNVKVFATTTDQLNQLVDWLIEQGVESVGNGKHLRLLDSDLRIAGVAGSPSASG
jgi:hypothetical protein